MARGPLDNPNSRLFLDFYVRQAGLGIRVLSTESIPSIADTESVAENIEFANGRIE